MHWKNLTKDNRPEHSLNMFIVIFTQNKNINRKILNSCHRRIKKLLNSVIFIGRLYKKSCQLFILMEITKQLGTINFAFKTKINKQSWIGIWHMLINIKGSYSWWKASSRSLNLRLKCFWNKYNPQIYY